MTKEYGFVYVLSNESMPGIYKIGFTMGHPKMRMEQLSSATACPTPFQLSACFGVENPAVVEKRLHDYLSQYRINSSREFFRVPAYIISHAICDYSDDEDDLVNTYGLSNDEQQDEVNDFIQERRKIIDIFHEQCADPIHWPVKRDFSGFDFDDEVPF